ncbi:MAG: hypothetical protein M3P18_13320, partial [Actinomycetota bacterium]|nr:hypothetical protein [Actinomycetota bacterium]
TNQVRSYPTRHWGAYGPDEVLPTKDAVWLCDSWDKEIKRFAVATHRVSAPVRTVGKGACPVAATRRSVWLLYSGHQTLTKIDANTGKQVDEWSIGPSISGTSGLWADAFGSLWFPGGRVVYRFDLGSGRLSPIAMPAGVRAATLVADEPSRTVWVGNCDPRYCGWISSLSKTHNPPSMP